MTELLTSKHQKHPNMHLFFHTYAQHVPSIQPKCLYSISLQRVQMQGPAIFVPHYCYICGEVANPTRGVLESRVSQVFRTRVSLKDWIHFLWYTGMRSVALAMTEPLPSRETSPSRSAAVLPIAVSDRKHQIKRSSTQIDSQLQLVLFQSNHSMLMIFDGHAYFTACATHNLPSEVRYSAVCIQTAKVPKKQGPTNFRKGSSLTQTSHQFATSCPHRKRDSPTTEQKGNIEKEKRVFPKIVDHVVQKRYAVPPAHPLGLEGLKYPHANMDFYHVFPIFRGAVRI
ncbi:hypothetical protein HYFRA_00000382 [Hymenoscyphus fraxineus]|uniref:Uncharacterized protein n=1 Tax=Hymenoscyphus fraxineus TaxID=746836 RepID=A0A9N9L4K5_9HELO|nr:hypothetical protein HYFRA_00000382 [Hymenoscyphus fraxineus]